MHNITIDPKIFTALGVTLDDTQREALLQHFQETLEERVGLAVFDLLSDDEAEELLKVSQAGDDAATHQWVSAHVPDLAHVIQDEYDILLGELADHADRL